MFARHTAALAVSLAVFKLGSSDTINTALAAVTTSNSVKVKPLDWFSGEGRSFRTAFPAKVGIFRRPGRLMCRPTTTCSPCLLTYTHNRNNSKPSLAFGSTHHTDLPVHVAAMADGDDLDRLRAVINEIYNG